MYLDDGRKFVQTQDDLVLPEDAEWLVSHERVKEPSLMVRFSGDGGKTFGQELTREMGALGEYGQLMRIRSFGQYRRLTVEVSMSSQQEMYLDSFVNLEVA